jgi:hypothetical protein
VEALIDMRVELPSEITLETIASFYDKIKIEFPDKQNRMSWKSDFQLRPGTVPEVSAPSGGPDGLLFHPADKSKIVQARLDGFTFNKLRPYQKIEVLPLILDMDVIRNVALSPTQPELWVIFEELRKFKNEIFLRSLTEKTKGLFQ